MSFDFNPAPGLVALRTKVRQFIDEVAQPAESHLSSSSHGLSPDVLIDLRARARELSIFAPTAPVEFGGLGLNHTEQAVILEEAGRSMVGPAALNCSAPDEGNILLLAKVADADQTKQYLEPLARGEIRSAFAMTEPAPGAGSDPEMLRTSATRVPGGWRIDGRKWFITGADGAAFLIVMAKTEAGATMFLVDEGHDGMRITRRIATLDSTFSGGHCEVEFDGCVVGDDAILGELDRGFQYAQVRLGPARLTHCMRWLGAARRAHEVAVGYAADREMFGGTLAGLGMAQQMIADNEIDVAASRGLIQQAAWALDSGSPARRETSIAKVFVAEATFRIVDRSMQLCGAFGISEDSPVSQLFREIRPFRIYDGPSEVHRWSIARRSVRRHRDGHLPEYWG